MLVAARYGSHRTGTLAAAQTPSAAAPAKPQKPSKVVAAPVHTASSKVRVAITAKQTSWLEVRNRSATGRVLFSGELAAGQRLHLAGTRLWARFGAAGNLTITANGRPVTLIGTYEHTFYAQKH